MPLLANDSVFRVANYCWFFLARQFISQARQITTVAISWHAYDLARTPTATGGLGMDAPSAAFLIGMIGLAQFVPVFFLSLIGGQAADRMNRKHILIAAQLVRVASTICLMASPFLSATPCLVILFTTSAIFGATNAFTPAAANAFYPTLVSREQLPKAVVWNTMGFQIAVIIGPAMAGLLLIAGEVYAYGVALLLSASSILLFLQIEAPQHIKKAGARGLAMVFEGLRYVFQNKIVLGAITLDFVAVFFGGAIALLPVFARDILNVGEEGFGLLRAAPAIGAVLVAALLSRNAIKQHIGYWMFGSVILFGLSILVFGQSRIVWLSALALIVYGGADMISMYIRGSLIQLSTPDDMKGRVSSTNFIFVSASNELGEFESGVAARFLGPVGAVMLGGVVAIATGLIWMGLFPSLRKADNFEGIEEQKVS